MNRLEVYSTTLDSRRHGNWIKQAETCCSSESGQAVCDPSLVTYRTITHYPETAGHDHKAAMNVSRSVEVTYHE
jgi:hypothetical protein